MTECDCPLVYGILCCIYCKEYIVLRHTLIISTHLLNSVVGNCNRAVIALLVLSVIIYFIELYGLLFNVCYVKLLKSKTKVLHTKQTPCVLHFSVRTFQGSPLLPS